MTDLKIISWNVNGIRTRIKNKDINPIFEKEPDIILFQETKTHYEQMDKKFLENNDYEYYFLKGESARTGGLATFTKKMPKIVKRFFNKSNDALGRASVLEFDNFTLIHLYSPAGTGKKANLLEKLEFYESLLNYANKNQEENLIIAGDFNIAHNEIDISDKNTKVTFTEDERKVLDQLESFGFVDAYRLFSNDETYSFFKNKEENNGARLDYFYVSKSLKDNIKSSSIYTEIESSKHCPIEVELEL